MASTVRRLSTHDRKVREVARELTRQGYKVRADIRGREQPHPVGSQKRVPDIEATKGRNRLIVEVETPTSLKTDQKQLADLAGFARRSPATSFRLVVTRPRKSHSLD